jgi:hypothetical protein
MTDYEREKFMAQLGETLRPLRRALEESNLILGRIADSLEERTSTEAERLKLERRLERGSAHRS